MTLTKKDYTIFDKFGFDIPPVGVKFLTEPPDTVERLEGNMALCEMLSKAQQGDAFFALKEGYRI